MNYMQPYRLNIKYVTELHDVCAQNLFSFYSVFRLVALCKQPLLHLSFDQLCV